MSYDPDRHTIIVYQDKATLFKSVLPSLFGGLIVVPILIYRYSEQGVFKFIALLACVLLLLWEMMFLPSIRRLLFPQPIVLITDKGIDYQPPSPWFFVFGMTMQWEEMAAMYLNEVTIRGKKRTRTYRFLCIVPKDQEVYSQKHKLLRPRRLPLLAMMSKMGSPFLIPEQMIFPLTPDDLLSQIRAHYQEQIQAHGIEMREEQKTSIG